MQNRMTAADYRHGTGLGSYQKLDLPMSFSNSTDLDTRVAYDANGRIRGKRSGGVSSGDSAVYHYYPDSYRVERVTGKLSGTGTRVASASGTFQYDAAGNMVEDRSKDMTISYGDDGMPTLIKVDSTLRLRPLYDASGYRVSEAALHGPFLDEAALWVGYPETSQEDGFTYDVSTLVGALEHADSSLNTANDPAPDSLVFFVVLDQGYTSMAPEWDSLTAIAKDDTLVPVRVYGMRKFSARYDILRSLREGRLMAARHWVSLGGQVLGEVTEGYDESEELASTRLVVPLYGRGTPVGRVVHTDTGEVTQFYVKNHLGSMMRVVNVDGSYATTPAFDYQAYGEPQVVRDDAENPAGPRYTGKELDTEVNLYYFGARWYDAELGMWLGPDPKAQYHNPYSYGDGMVVIGVDEDGEFFFTAIIVATAAYGAYKGYKAGGGDAFARGDWLTGLAYVGGGAAIGASAVYGGAVAGAAVGTFATGLAGTTVLAAGGSATAAGITGAVVGGAAAGVTGGAAAYSVDYLGNSAMGVEQGSFLSGLGQAALYGGISGGVFSGAGYGLSSTYRAGVDQTIQNFYNNNPGYVSAVKGVVSRFEVQQNPNVVERQAASAVQRAESRFLDKQYAEGSKTEFKTHNGKVVRYETKVPQTNPRNPNPWKTEIRFDGVGRRGHFNKALQIDIPIPHVHDPLTPGGVRSPFPWELPNGY